MLDLMLGHGTDTFSCGEVYAWFRPWRTHHFKIVCSCGQSPCAKWNNIKDVHESLFHREAARQLEVPFIIDSSKELCWLADSQIWAKTGGQTVFNFALWKDPLSMAYSNWKRNKPVEEWVKSYVIYYERLLSLEIPFLSIEYGQLAGEPERLVKRICELTGLEWFDGKERFWEGNHHHLFGSKGTRNQSDAGDSQIRRKELFPSEFKEEISKIQKSLEAFSGLQDVLYELKARDIETLGFDGLSPYRRPRVMPSWYYERAVKRMFRRQFPQKWHLDQ